jgi:hypothetical protein
MLQLKYIIKSQLISLNLASLKHDLFFSRLKLVSEFPLLDFVNFLFNMPNSTSMQKFVNFIDERKLVEMQKWSTRNRYMSDGQLMRLTRQMIKNIRKILLIISGNDVTAILIGNLVSERLN